MIAELILSLYMNAMSNKYFKNYIDILNKLERDGYHEIVEYVKSPKFKVYPNVLKLNKKSMKIDYTDTKKSSYIRPYSIARAEWFMIKYRKWLEKAEKKFGVDREYITALLNLESSLGKNTGKYPVLNALFSQALFARNEKRKKFFLRELEEFLKLTKKYGWDVFEVKGSFAGAMGPMQFMPSSVNRYGTDFDGDGFRVNDIEDAIGSAANYLSSHGFSKNPRKALRSYNPSDNYVKAIVKQAQILKRLDKKFFRRKKPNKSKK